jgi:hypothetical protein
MERPAFRVAVAVGISRRMFPFKQTIDELPDDLPPSPVTFLYPAQVLFIILVKDGQE